MCLSDGHITIQVLAITKHDVCHLYCFVRLINQLVQVPIEDHIVGQTHLICQVISVTAVLLHEADQNLSQLWQTESQVGSLLVDILMDCVNDFPYLQLLLSQDVGHGVGRHCSLMAALVVM